MEEDKLQQHLSRLGSANFWEQVEAAWQLARSADRRALSAVLDLLEQPTHYHHEIISNIVDGLVQGAPGTLQEVFAHLKASPLSPGGLKCATVLGEIAYRQGNARDPRIVPALLEALQAALTGGTQLCLYATAGLRECARAGKLPEAEAAMWSLLRLGREEPTPYLGTLDNALEVLYANHGSELMRRLNDYVFGVSANHNLSIAITEFIAAKENRNK